MTLQTFFESAFQALMAASSLEKAAVFFGLIQVILAKSNKVSTYFFGIVGILLTLVVLYRAGLYAEIFLNGYYLVMSIYGWYYWLQASPAATQRPITLWTKADQLRVVYFVGLGFLLLYAFLRFLTDSDVPVWDAIVSSTAWAGMWLLAKRKLQNWILLNCSNLIAIPLFVHKELYFFALLTIVQFIVAIFGYYHWKKIYAQAPKTLSYDA